MDERALVVGDDHAVGEISKRRAEKRELPSWVGGALLPRRAVPGWYRRGEAGRKLGDLRAERCAFLFQPRVRHDIDPRAPG
ncbi:hypothetical protein [Polyangium fumosum]|uniref:hypothetical protein n=1 Tax=Polyangium fumosum TaxID=889272 RepID=UPI001E332133|nr:hypothetical protein [Polyangium fumosum]